MDISPSFIPVEDAFTIVSRPICCACNNELQIKITTTKGIVLNKSCSINNEIRNEIVKKKKMKCENFSPNKNSKYYDYVMGVIQKNK